MLDSDSTEVPDDVKEKILTFVKAGLAVAQMKGKSYLSMGSVSMGIAGSIVDANFFEEFLGMRCEYVDMSEFTRRIDRGIFDPEELESAKSWIKQNCKEGKDYNPTEEQKSQKQKDKDWDFVAKMTLIGRDLMVGNPKLKDLGFGEEAQGHNAIAAGFQRQRHWTDHFPNGDFMEAVLCSSFDWNGIRQPYMLATENDSLNAVAMMFGHLLEWTRRVLITEHAKITVPCISNRRLLYSFIRS